MIRHVETSKTSKKKKDRLLNVKGKEMGISGEYRLEYMPLMIQKKNQVEFRIAMIGWARLSFLLFLLGCFVLVFYSAQDLGRVYVHNVLKSLSSILIVSTSLSSSYC